MSAAGALLALLRQVARLSPPPLGPSAPQVEADILTQGSPLLSPNTSRQLLSRGPSSCVPGQGLQRFLWWEEVQPSGNTEATPGSLRVGPCDLIQLEMACLAGPSVGGRLLPPSVGCISRPSIFVAI